MTWSLWGLQYGMDEATSYTKQLLCSLLADGEQTTSQCKATSAKPKTQPQEPHTTNKTKQKNQQSKRNLFNESMTTIYLKGEQKVQERCTVPALWSAKVDNESLPLISGRKIEKFVL